VGFRVQGVVQHSLLYVRAHSSYSIWLSPPKSNVVSAEERGVFANQFLIGETHIDSD
jgi:hypothetical protein